MYIYIYIYTHMFLFHRHRWLSVEELAVSALLADQGNHNIQ